MLCKCFEIRGKCKESRRIKEISGSFRRFIEKRVRERSGGGKNECSNGEYYFIIKKIGLYLKYVRIYIRRD